MADEVETKVLTKDELIQAIGEAYNKGDYKGMGKLSSQMAKVEVEEAKVVKAAKEDAAKELTEGIKAAINKVLKPIYESGKLDVADGVWYSWDFGDGTLMNGKISGSNCRLLKGTTRKAGGGTGGGGKKFSITTNELLAKHGSEQMGDSGKTFQAAYDEDTDGNSRYKVRMKLLKVDGQS